MPTDTPQPDPFTEHRLQHEINNAVHLLKTAILQQAEHGLDQVNLALHFAGIDHPQGAAGVRDLAMQRDTMRDAIVDQMKEKLSEMKATERWQTYSHREIFLEGAQEMIDFVENYNE